MSPKFCVSPKFPETAVTVTRIKFPKFRAARNLVLSRLNCRAKKGRGCEVIKSFSLGLGLLVLIGCAAAPRESLSGRMQAFDQVTKSAVRPIIIYGQTRVCVSVHVDERLRRRFYNVNPDRSFSSGLASNLERLYIKSGGSRLIPESSGDLRFTLKNLNEPICQRPAAIRIRGLYILSANGEPFTFSFRIEQGQQVRVGSVTKDMEADFRSGKVRRTVLNSVGNLMWDDENLFGELIMEQVKIQ